MKPATLGRYITVAAGIVGFLALQVSRSVAYFLLLHPLDLDLPLCERPATLPAPMLALPLRRHSHSRPRRDQAAARPSAPNPSALVRTIGARLPSTASERKHISIGTSTAARGDENEAHRSTGAAAWSQSGRHFAFASSALSCLM